MQNISKGKTVSIQFHKKKSLKYQNFIRTFEIHHKILQFFRFSTKLMLSQKIQKSNKIAFLTTHL